MIEKNYNQVGTVSPMTGRIQDAVRPEWAWQQELCLRCYLEKEKRKGLGIAKNNEEKNFPVKGEGPVKESS